MPGLSSFSRTLNFTLLVLTSLLLTACGGSSSSSDDSTSDGTSITPDGSTGGPFWVSQATPTNERLNGIYFVDDDNGWAAGTVGTLLHTNDGGENWQAQLSGTTASLEDIHFTDGNNGWAVGLRPASDEPGVALRTQDGGQTWTQELATENSNFRAVFFLNADTGWIAGGDGNSSGAGDNLLLHTTDGGDTWSEMAVTSEEGFLFADVFFIDSQNGWVTTAKASIHANTNRIFVTTDGGDNWTEGTYGEPLRPDQAVRFADTNNGWAAGSYGTLLATNNGGVNWERQPTPSGSLISALFVEDAQTVWAVNAHRTVLRTTDGGVHWQRHTCGLSHIPEDIHFNASGEGWVAGRRGAIFRYNPDGQDDGSCVQPSGLVDWEAQQLPNAPSTSRPSAMSFISDTHGWIVGYGSGASPFQVVHTADGGQTWTEQVVTDAGFFQDIHFVDQNWGWAVGNTGLVFRTLDGGENWTKVDNVTPQFQNPNLYSVFFQDRDNGWISGSSGTIYVTSDGGSNWTEQTSGVTSRIYGLDFVDANYGWAAADDEILATTDGGANWSIQRDASSSGDEENFRDVWFHDRNIGWVVGYNGTVLHTTNGGGNWSVQDAGLGGSLTAVQFANATTGWITGWSNRLLRTDNAGQSWQAEKTQSPIYSFYDLHLVSADKGWVVGETSALGVVHQLGGND